MARVKKEPEVKGTPLWMVTFTDLMTLLLTFFVLMISMSQIDERRTRDFLINTRGNPGIGVGILNPLAKSDQNTDVEPGPMEAENSEDLESMRSFMWDNKEEDINLESNRFIITLSLGENVLFEAGGSQITPNGLLVLDSLVPQLKGFKYPMLVAGHTATQRDEAGSSYLPFSGNVLSPTWKLSFLRALAVYEHFLARGIPASSMMVEAFGEFRPKASNATPTGRQINRRVDLVLDRRNSGNLNRFKLQNEPDRENIYEYKDFRFKLDIAPARESDGGASLGPLSFLGKQGAINGTA